jgi:hypothetical protein
MWDYASPRLIANNMTVISRRIVFEANSAHKQFNAITARDRLAIRQL